MTDREKLIALCEDVILSCKASLCADCEHSNIDYPHCMEVHFADHLLANGVVVRENGEWRRVYEEGEGWVDICTRCKAIGDETDFCPNCGADTRKGENKMREFNTGAVRDDATGKGRYDLLPWGAIHALAQHCERGALHYGERNVDKGIPQHSLIDSGLRHLGQYIQGDAEPHHLVAALWNIAWAVEQEIKRPELVDLPARTEKSGSAI